MDLSHTKDLIIDPGFRLVIFLAYLSGGVAMWLFPRRRWAGHVQPVLYVVLWLASWAIVDPGSETRQGLAMLVGIWLCMATILLLDEVLVRFWSSERRVRAVRPKTWTRGAAIAAIAASVAAVLAIWVALPEAAPEHVALVWTLSHGVPFAAGIWGLVVLTRVGWQAFLAVGEGQGAYHGSEPRYRPAA